MHENRTRTYAIHTSQIVSRLVEERLDARLYSKIIASTKMNKAFEAFPSHINTYNKLHFGYTTISEPWQTPHCKHHILKVLDHFFFVVR